MFLAAEEPLRGKDVWVGLLNPLRYDLPVYIGFLANPIRNRRFIGLVSRICNATTGSVHFSLLHNR